MVRPGGRIANIGVHGQPATLHLEDQWTRDITITTRPATVRRPPSADGGRRSTDVERPRLPWSACPLWTGSLGRGALSEPAVSNLVSVVPSRCPRGRVGVHHAGSRRRVRAAAVSPPFVTHHFLRGTSSIRPTTFPRTTIVRSRPRFPKDSNRKWCPAGPRIALGRRFQAGLVSLSRRAAVGGLFGQERSWPVGVAPNKSVARYRSHRRAAPSGQLGRRLTMCRPSPAARRASRGLVIARSDQALGSLW